MKLDTPEKQQAYRERCARANEQLREAYRTMDLIQLVKDWHCGISGEAREILQAEFDRRGINPKQAICPSCRRPL